MSNEGWTPPPGVRAEVLLGSLEEPALVARVTLDPGAEVPSEVHEDHREHVVPLSGAIVVDCRNSLRSGFDIATIYAGTPHTIRNRSSTEPAEYLSIMRRD